MSVKSYTGVVSAANTNRDGTGTIVDLVTGVTNGTKVENVEITATGVTTAGMVRLYLYDGTNTRLLKEVAVTAITPSATVKAFTDTYSPGKCFLATGQKLQASTHNAEAFHVVVNVIEY